MSQDETKVKPAPEPPSCLPRCQCRHVHDPEWLKAEIKGREVHQYLLICRAAAACGMMPRPTG
jgi:hypothetical protein